MWSHGNFYWNELMTRDVEKAKRFYGGSVGWTFDAMPMDGDTYWVAKMGGQPRTPRSPPLSSSFDSGFGDVRLYPDR